jgi:hypothetical protein
VLWNDIKNDPLGNKECVHDAVVAFLNGKPIQLRNFGRSIPGRILLEYMTCNEIYVDCNHGNERNADCFRKTI